MSKKIKLALFVMVFGTFFGLLCSTLMNNALPTLMRVYHLSLTQVQWVTNSYMLVNAIMIPFSAYLIKRFRFRQLFLVAAGIFFVGTGLGAVAPNFGVLLLARITQAIGTGMMMPLVNVLAMSYAPPHHQGAIMGVIGLAFNFSPIIGPTLSGAILNHLSWRYLFILILPFALLTLILAGFLLPSIEKDAHIRLDLRGVTIISLGLLSLLWGLSNISEIAQKPWLVGGAIILGLLLGAGFLRAQTTSQTPLINLHIFQNVDFRRATFLNTLIIVTMYGNTILLPLLVQNDMHQSPLVSGLTLLPGAMLTGVMSPLSGKLVDRYPLRNLVTIGLIIDCTGTILQAFIGVKAGVGLITVGQTVRQFGLVLVLIPLQTHALATLPKYQIPDGVATFNTLRQVAAAMGTAVITAVVTIINWWFATDTGSDLVGIQAGFLLCLILLVTCLIFVLIPVVIPALKLKNAAKSRE